MNKMLKFYVTDICPKNYQHARIFMIAYLSEKLKKTFHHVRLINSDRTHLHKSTILHDNLHDICPKNARILRNNCPKKYFSRIFLGHVPTCSPVSYAHGGENEIWLAPSLKKLRPPPWISAWAWALSTAWAICWTSQAFKNGRSTYMYVVPFRCQRQQRVERCHV